MSDKIAGRNPVIEALKSGRDIEKILLVEGTKGRADDIVALARERKVPFSFVEKEKIDKLVETKKHQGVLAFVSAYQYSLLDDVFDLAESRGEDPFLVILDDIEDPHNLGAIIRTAECAGVHGVIIPKRRAAGLTEAAVKASAGAIEYMPCVRVSNIAQTVDELKKRGLWIAACDMGDDLYYQADLKGPIGIVIGNEGKGISRLVGEKCDFKVSIPMKGQMNSLNASNAAAIVIYEIRRQRDVQR